MKSYLLLLRGGVPMTNKSDAENKAESEAWNLYMGMLTQQRILVDGLPLASGGRTVFKEVVIHEPVLSADEGIIGGYLIVQAENMEDAVDIARKCPHLDNKGNIEVREIAPMPAL